MKNVIHKTTIALSVVVVVGIAIFLVFPAYAAGGMAIIGLVGMIVMGIISIFKKRYDPVFTLTFSVWEGLLVGGTSKASAVATIGAVPQVILVTFMVIIGAMMLQRASY